MARAEASTAAVLRDCGVQVSVTSKVPVWSAPAWVVGSMRQPLAKASMSTGAPRVDPPSIRATQPALMLWPMTSWKGTVPASVTRRCSDVDVCDSVVTVGAGSLTGGVIWSPTAGGAVDPPAAESRVRASRSNPDVWPSVAWITWVPGPRESPVASGPHSETSRASRARAAAEVPETEIHTGRPSTVSRSSRQVVGMSVGTGAAWSPGMPTSATPMGMDRGDWE